VIDGFETEFTFKIDTPAGQARASDGFAFVLQNDRAFFRQPKNGGPEYKKDRTHSTALGSSGMQLGFGGLTSCFAVQFTTRPSCAEKVTFAKAGVDGEGDKGMYLCSLMHEPKFKDDGSLDIDNCKTSYFYVNALHEGKECIDPASTKIFEAPELEPGRKSKPVPLEKSYPHHCDRVAVQCPGVHPNISNSTGPECCMGWSGVREPLDSPRKDNEPHRCRIIFEKNRFRVGRPDPQKRVAKVADTEKKKLEEQFSKEQLAQREEKAALEAVGALGEGAPSHRLLVYLDDMRQPLINLELEAAELFGGDAEVLEQGRMYAGFTAATGRTNAAHKIQSWTFYEVAGTAPGFKWQRIDDKPKHGKELKSERLAERLKAGDLTFTQAELDEFEVKGLGWRSYIQAGGAWYKPAFTKVAEEAEEDEKEEEEEEEEGLIGMVGNWLGL
jgi:hypothetical protein